MGARRDHGSGTLISRGEDRWLLRIDYGRDPLTKQRVRRSQTVIGSKTVAQRRMRELLAERDSDAGIPSRLTLGEWLEEWLELHFADHRINEQVRLRYQGIINGHIMSVLVDTDPKFSQTKGVIALEIEGPGNLKIRHRNIWLKKLP